MCEEKAQLAEARLEVPILIFSTKRWTICLILLFLCFCSGRLIYRHSSFNQEHRGVVVFLVCIHLRSIDLRRIWEKRSSTEKPRWQDAGQLFTFSLRLLTTEKLSCASHDDLNGDNIFMIFAKQLKCTSILFSLYHKINETTSYRQALTKCDASEAELLQKLEVRKDHE